MSILDRIFKRGKEEWREKPHVLLEKVNYRPMMGGKKIYALPKEYYIKEIVESTGFREIGHLDDLVGVVGGNTHPFTEPEYSLPILVPVKPKIGGENNLFSISGTAFAVTDPAEGDLTIDGRVIRGTSGILADIYNLRLVEPKLVKEVNIRRIGTLQLQNESILKPRHIDTFALSYNVPASLDRLSLRDIEDRFLYHMNLSPKEAEKAVENYRTRIKVGLKLAEVPQNKPEPPDPKTLMAQYGDQIYRALISAADDNYHAPGVRTLQTEDRYEVIVGLPFEKSRGVHPEFVGAKRMPDGSYDIERGFQWFPGSVGFTVAHAVIELRNGKFNVFYTTDYAYPGGCMTTHPLHPSVEEKVEGAKAALSRNVRNYRLEESLLKV